MALYDSICGGGKQPVPANSAVPMLAQLYAYSLFRYYFRSPTRYPAGATYHDWDIIQGAGSGNSLLDMAAGQIRSDMRNYTSQSARSKALARAGEFSQLREGRQLRGDGIGLAIDPLERKIVCELLEVTTIDDAKDCIKEDLMRKLALLRGPVKALLDDKLRQLSMNASFVPQEFVASGTPWIIPAELALVPIFDTGTEQPQPSKYRWICFAPTYEYRPYPGLSPELKTPEPETEPARGLILYSYHEAQPQAGVPVEVVKRFVSWVKARPANSSDPFGLLPAPEANRYWQNNSADLKQLLGYLALGVLAVGVVVLAIYLAPALFPLEATALFNAATAPALLTATRGATLVQQFATALPATLATARLAINSAINVGGGGGLSLFPTR